MRVSCEQHPLCITLTVAMLLYTASTAYGQQMPVPIELQAELFKRIFSYDRTIDSDTKIHVLIVHSEEDSEKAGQFVSAFQNADIDATPVKVNSVGQFPEATAVYFLPTTEPTAELEGFCTENHVLSLSGVPDLAEGGSVSVAIGEAKNRPEIIVSMNRLKMVGHILSAALLKLAKIIR